MIKLLYVAFAFLAGMMVAFQAPINSALGKKIGGLEGALVSLSVGSMTLFFIVLFFGKGQILQVFSVPKWLIIGGFFGAAFVTIIIISIPFLGVATTIFATIFGQIVISLIIDHFGLFGVQKIPIDWYRCLGLLLMLIALTLIFRGNFVH